MASLIRNLTGAALGAALIGLAPVAAHATSSATSSLSSWEGALPAGTTYSETADIATQIPLANGGNELKLSSGTWLKILAPTSAPSTATVVAAGWSGSHSTVDDVLESAAGKMIKFSSSVSPYLPSSIGSDYGFGFYVMPLATGTWTVTATASDSTAVSFNIAKGTAQFMGFYNLAGVTGITVSATCDTGCSGNTGLAVGDFFDAQAVPEPASMALLGAGMAGLGWVRRRRNRKNA